MSEILEIQNFGPIKNAKLDLKRYMVFIGPQASGKSTVAKVLAIFKDFDFVLQESPDYKKVFNDYNIGNFFSESTVLKYSNHNYTISISNEKLEIVKQPNFAEKVVSEKSRIRKFLADYIETRKTAKQPNPITDEEAYLELLYNVNWKRMFDFKTENTYIPAERVLLSLVRDSPFSLISNNTAIPKCVTKFGSDFENAKRSQPTFSIDFLNITFRSENGKQRVYYENNKSVDLSESASGFQSIIPICLVVSDVCHSNQSPSFIIEEPELNLFPTTQKQLINFLFREIQKEKVEADLIITTHSPYILSSINILLLAFIAANKSSENREKVRLISDETTWINPSEFNAFYFANGTTKEIFNRELGVISGNELDYVSEDIDGVYEDIMNVYTNA